MFRTVYNGKVRPASLSPLYVYQRARIPCSPPLGGARRAQVISCGRLPAPTLRFVSRGLCPWTIPRPGRIFVHFHSGCIHLGSSCGRIHVAQMHQISPSGLRVKSSPYSRRGNYLRFAKKKKVYSLRNVERRPKKKVLTYLCKIRPLAAKV